MIFTKIYKKIKKKPHEAAERFIIGLIPLKR